MGAASADESDSIPSKRDSPPSASREASAGVREGKGLDPPRPPPPPPRGGASAPDPRWVGATGLMNTDAAVSGLPFTYCNSLPLLGCVPAAGRSKADPHKWGASAFSVLALETNRTSLTHSCGVHAPPLRRHRTWFLTALLVAVYSEATPSLGVFYNGPRRVVGYVARALLVCTRPRRAAWLWTRLSHAYVYVSAGVSRSAPGVFIFCLGGRLSGFV